MNGRLRLILCGVCVAIGVFHAPTSTHVLCQDISGPYAFFVRAARTSSSDARVAALLAGKHTDSLDVANGHAGTRRSPERR